MVTMDTEHRNAHIQVGILIVNPGKLGSMKVRLLIAEKLNLYRTIPETVLPKKGGGFVNCSSARFVVVEEISSEQDHIYFLFYSMLEYLFERYKTVITSDSVFLLVTKMIIWTNLRINLII